MTTSEVLYKLKIDLSGAKPAFEEVRKDAAALSDISPKVDFKNLSSLKAELASLVTVRDNAFDFKTAEIAQAEIKKVEKEIAELSEDIGLSEKESKGFFSNFKEGLSGIGTISIGTALGEGLKDMFSGFVAKATEADHASDSLQIALAKAGVSAANSKAEMATLGTAASKIADDFAIPKLQVTELQAKIAGFGNVTGEKLNQLTEFSIGAANALQLPAEAVARLIAKSSDPEQAATLARLGIVFDKNADSAEKMRVIEAKLGPAVEATKASTQDAIGDFDRLKNTVEEAAISFASQSFEALQPLFQQLIPVVTSLGDVLVAGGKALGSVATFASEHKVAVLSLVGAYVAFRAASAISDAGGIAKVFSSGATAANQFAASILSKLIPGYSAEAAAATGAATAHSAVAASEVAEGAAAAEASVGQAILNAVMAANPVFLLIAGVGALIGVYALLSSGTKDIGEATKDAASALDEFNTHIGKAKGIDEQNKSLGELSARYDELQGKSSRTAAEQTELDSVTAKLAKSVPEAVEGFDAFSGGMSIATGRVRDFIKEQQNLSADEKKDAVDSLTDKTGDLANSYKEAQDKLAALQAQQKLLDQNVNVPTGVLDFFKQQVGLGESVQEKQKETLHQLVQQREELEKARPQLQANIKALESQGKSAQEIADKLHLSVEEVNKLVPLQQQAAAATKEQVVNVESLASAYDEARKKQEESLNETKSAYKQAIADNQKLQASATATDEQKQQAEQTIAFLKEKGIKEVQQKKANQKIDQQTDRDFGDIQAKEQQSRFQTQLKLIEADSKTRTAATKETEANLNKTAADEFIKGSRQKAELSKTENAKLLQQEVADITAQREALLKLATTDDAGNIVALQPKLSKKGHEAEDLATLKEKVASLTLELSKKEVELSTKIKPLSTEQIEKFNHDLAAALEATAFKEIEIGIRPKSDALPIIQDRIKAIQKEIDDKGLILFTANVTPEEAQKLQLEILKLNQDKLAAQNDYHTKSIELDKSLQDARIALIDNEVVREREAIFQKIQADEDYFNRRRELGKGLTQDEQSLEQALLTKHYKDLLALNRKYEEEKVATTRQFAEQGLTIIVDNLTKAYEASKKLSKAEYDDKVLSFDKERGALEDSHARAEIGDREYNVKLAKLNEERTALEKEQNASSADRFVTGLAKSYNAALGEAGKYFTNLATKYLLDTALHNAAETQKLIATQTTSATSGTLSQLDSTITQTVETTKTSTTQAGVVARIDLYNQETIAALATAKAKTGDAVATTVASGISLTGFLGVALAIAEGAAVSLAIQGLINAISIKGFKKGGIIAGEGGQVELIQPASEFAQFASQLVTQVVMKTERSLAGRNEGSSNNNGGMVDVNVTGKVVTKGRDITYQLERDKVSSKTERITGN